MSNSDISVESNLGSGRQKNSSLFASAVNDQIPRQEDTPAMEIYTERPFVNTIGKNNLKISVTNVICQSCDFSRLTDIRDLNKLFDSLHDRFSTAKDDGTHQEWTKYYEFPRLLLNEDRSEEKLTPLVLQPSLFHRNNVPPTIYFNTKLNDNSRPPISLPQSLSKHFRWKYSTITPNSIRHCISFSKLEIIKSSTISEDFLGSWCRHMLTSDFYRLQEWRKVNHFPGSFNMGRKDRLWMKLNLATKKFGSEEFGEFHPRTFVLPMDYDELNSYWSKSKSKLFIMKPPASSRGNGIKVINNINQIPSNAYWSNNQAFQSKKSTMIVQRYISNPCLLENGQKFDLRIYVLLTSIDPLRVYIYREGLVRFASSKYNIQEDGIIDQFMHLTNYFINKNSHGYKINNDCDSLNGSKWTLSRFWRHLEEHYPDVDTKHLWSEIVDIIVKTVVCCEGSIARYSRPNCKNDYTSYELFGFDIILDENFKPWILEVNITPSLKSDSDLDAGVKYRVIKDMFNLVGYNLPPSTAQECKSYDRPFWFNPKVYAENLTKEDRAKQQKFQTALKTEYSEESMESGETSVITNSSNETDITSNSDQTSQFIQHDTKNISLQATKIENISKVPSRQVGESILDCLTQNDIRVLMLSEDELSRRGDFLRAFPCRTSQKYLKYFEKPRYNNFLLDAWEQAYADRRLDGIIRLSNEASFLN